MDSRQISSDFHVSGQLSAADIAAAAGDGFGAIINNRPDGEAPGQPGHAEIEQAAQAAGLDVAYLPVQGGGLTPEIVAAFAQALDEMPKPVLAYCASGTRSAALWALSQAGRMSADEILAATAAAGYELGGLRPHLER